MSESEIATGPPLQENMEILIKRWNTLAIIFHNNSISTDLNLKVHDQSPMSLIKSPDVIIITCYPNNAHLSIKLPRHQCSSSYPFESSASCISLKILSCYICLGKFYGRRTYQIVHLLPIVLYDSWSSCNWGKSLIYFLPVQRKWHWHWTCCSWSKVMKTHLQFCGPLSYLPWVLKQPGCSRWGSQQWWWAWVAKW